MTFVLWYEAFENGIFDKIIMKQSGGILVPMLGSEGQ